jgi:hypothetical protein
MRVCFLLPRLRNAAVFPISLLNIRDDLTKRKPAVIPGEYVRMVVIASTLSAVIP